MIKFTFDDGGRAAAGYKGTAGDCVCRAVAIATGRPYREVYAALDAFCADDIRHRMRGRSSAREGVVKPATRAYLASLGWRWTPTMRIGSGCRVHLRTDELPPGRIIVSLSKHIATVIDGVLHDTHDSSRDGTRCVYGYWSPP